jgi:hypothetical protein
MPLKSDPLRLPRRNHFQEGPDFVFVATQGRRPMAAEPVGSPVAVVRGRARTIRLSSAGTSISEVCTAGRCSRAYQARNSAPLRSTLSAMYWAS